MVFTIWRVYCTTLLTVLYCTSILMHLSGGEACESERSYQEPRIGVSNQKMALHVRVHFYVDKELMVSGGERLNITLIMLGIPRYTSI